VADEPNILGNEDVATRVEATALNQVAELNVRPDLTLRAQADIVVDVEATQGIQDDVAAEPAVPANAQGQRTVREAEGVQLAVIAEPELRRKNSGFPTHVGKIAENDASGLGAPSADEGAGLDDNAATDLEVLSLDDAMNLRLRRFH